MGEEDENLWYSNEIPLDTKLKLLYDLRSLDNSLIGGNHIPWKDDPDKLPEGSKKALEKLKKVSKEGKGIKGTTIDPSTGKEITKFNLYMKRKFSDKSEELK